MRSREKMAVATVVAVVVEREKPDPRSEREAITSQEL